MWISYKIMLLWGCIFCAATTVNAQQQHNPKWYGLLQQGIVFNASQVNVQPGVVAGWQTNGYGIGLATGVDFIAITSLQAAIDLRKTFHVGRHGFVVYANPGYNMVIPSKSDKEKIGWQVGADNKIKSGIYLEGGGGLLLGKKKNLLAAVYWSRKNYKVLYSYRTFNPITAKIETSTGVNKYEYNRLGIKLGFIF